MNLPRRKYEPAGESGKASIVNERGMVLIVVLVMLLLLIILGTTLLTSVTTEIRLAGNNRNRQQTFFMSQGALEHVPVANAIINAMSEASPTWTGTITFNGNNIVVTKDAVAAAGAQNTAQITAEIILEAGVPPRGTGTSADKFIANYYDVDVIGMGPNNSEVEINSVMYKLQAKPE